MSARRALDSYPTPIRTVEAILPYIDFRGIPRILEPCAGDGNIVNLLPKHSDISYCEISVPLGVDAPTWPLEYKGYWLASRDYFEFNLNKYNDEYYEPNHAQHHFDLIITNPPFSHWREFLEKSLREADTVIYLLRLNVLGSGKKTGRADFFNQNRPTHIFCLEERPSFTGDGRTDGCDYAWICWDRGNRIKTKEPFNFIPAGDK